MWKRMRMIHRVLLRRCRLDYSNVSSITDFFSVTFRLLKKMYCKLQRTKKIFVCATALLLFATSNTNKLKFSKTPSRLVYSPNQI